MTRTRTAALLAAAAGLALAQSAAAQRRLETRGTGLAGGADAPLVWNNAAGGSASTTTNWAPNAMPGAADDLTFNLAAAFPVTFNSLVPTSRTHTYRQGTITLTATSPHSVSTGITIGDTNALSASVTFPSGTIDSASSVVIGSVGGSSGSLTVNDDSADFLVTGATADLTVGSNGDGTLSITNGGRVQVADQFIVGANFTSTSALTVSGAQNLPPFQRSTLAVLGTGQSRFGAGGDATVNIANGGTASFASDLVVCNGSASTSTVTIAGVGGLGSLTHAQLTVAGDLYLGRNTTVGTAAGAATLNANANSIVQVDGAIFVAGDDIAGTALLHMDDTADVKVGSLIMGTGATLDLDGGFLHVDGGTFANTSPSALVIGGAQHPIVALVGGATANLSTVVAGRSLNVGGGAGATSGSLDVRAGADLTISNGGDVILGDTADDNGTMTIDGANSSMTLQASSDLVVGLLGDGRFETQSGAIATGQRLIIASEVGSTGAALFEGPGTTAQFQSVFVGGDSLGSGGAGTLTVNDGALLIVPTAGSSVRVYPSGLADISSASMNVTGNMVVSGTLQFQGTGQLNTGALTLDGLLLAHPNTPGGPALVSGNVAANANSVIRAVNGDLTLGNPAALNGFSGVLSSTIETGANTITLLDLNEAEVGHVILGGGTLACPNVGIRILNSGSIDGTGTLEGDVFFASGGSVITATTAAGITIKGMLTNNSGTIDGSKFTFKDDPATVGPGGWTGAGAINARAIFDSNTEVVALGDVSMGFPTIDGVTFNGSSKMHLGNFNASLVDLNGVDLPVLTDMNGGELTSINGLTLFVGTIRGKGSINVTTGGLNMFGTIDPDTQNPATLLYENLGTFNIGGAYTLGSSSHYQCDLAGYDNEFRPLRDYIEATGPITLSGALDLNFVLGYTGIGRDTFDIIKGSTRVGRFTQVNSPPTPFGPAHVTYLPDRARVILCYANCDGSIGTPQLTANDFQCFLDRFAAADPYANCDASTGTPTLTANDFQCFLNKFAGNCQ